MGMTVLTKNCKQISGKYQSIAIFKAQMKNMSKVRFPFAKLSHFCTYLQNI